MTLAYRILYALILATAITWAIIGQLANAEYELACRDYRVTIEWYERIVGGE